MFQIKIDDKRVFYKENPAATVFWDIAAYVGDPWHIAADGIISDFEYSTQ